MLPPGRSACCRRKRNARLAGGSTGASGWWTRLSLSAGGDEDGGRAWFSSSTLWSAFLTDPPASLGGTPFEHDEDVEAPRPPSPGDAGEAATLQGVVVSS